MSRINLSFPLETSETKKRKRKSETMKIKEKEEKNLNLSLRSLENQYNVTGQQIFKKKKHPQWVDNLVHLCRSTV